MPTLKKQLEEELVLIENMHRMAAVSDVNWWERLEEMWTGLAEHHHQEEAEMFPRPRAVWDRSHLRKVGREMLAIKQRMLAAEPAGR